MSLLAKVAAARRETERKRGYLVQPIAEPDAPESLTRYRLDPVAYVAVPRHASTGMSERK